MQVVHFRYKSMEQYPKIEPSKISKTHLSGEASLLSGLPGVQSSNRVSFEDLDLGEECDLHPYLDITISTLSATINEEFNKEAGTKGESLFCLPEETCDYSLLEKAQMARDLADLLYQCKTNQDTRSSLQSIRSFRSSISRSWSELVPALFGERPEGLFLGPSEVQEVISLILNFAASSDTHLAKSELLSSQAKYIQLSRKLSKLLETQRKRQDELEQLSNANKKLNDSLGLLKKQEQVLEKQLEDAMVENYVNSEKHASLKVQLQEARETLRNLKTQGNTPNPFE